MVKDAGLESEEWTAFSKLITLSGLACLDITLMVSEMVKIVSQMCCPDADTRHWKQIQMEEIHHVSICTLSGQTSWNDC